MWKAVRSIYENHILIYPDIYISRDDIISINDNVYEITGISDDYDVYLQDQNKNKYVYQPHAFFQMLYGCDVRYIRNLHQECLDRNRRLCCLDH